MADLSKGKPGICLGITQTLIRFIFVPEYAIHVQMLVHYLLDKVLSQFKLVCAHSSSMQDEGA